MMFFRSTVLIVFLLVLFTSSVEANDKNLSNKKMRWHRLDTLIQKEINTINYVRNPGPSLRYRMLELYTEKLKLIKEKENQAFLNASSKKRKRLGRKHYFRKSKRYYNKAKKYGLNIVKKYPRYKHVADVFYTLALNSRDYGNNKETEKFLFKSLRKAPRRSPIRHLAKTSLAEYYYNNKKYHKAIKYYQHVLKNRSDEWHTKHLYNVSWCYLKVKKFKQAINHAKRAFRLGKNKLYISVEEQVLDSIGLFYVYGRKVRDGANFYIKNVPNAVPYLIKMANKSTDKGLFKDTRFLLKIALDDALKRNDFNAQAELHLSELEIYRQFSKYELYFMSAKRLLKVHRKSPLKQIQLEDAINKIKSLVGLFQIKLSQNAKKNINNYSTKRLKRIMEYFNILIALDPATTGQYRFFQGETNFSVEQHLVAMNYYVQALEFEKQNKKDDKLMRKIVKSMLSTLEEARWKKKTKNKHTIYTYSNHITLWPIDPTSRKIYSRLFNLYLAQRRINQAIETLSLYNKHYPKDLKKHQGMLTRVIDYYIKTKNTDQLSSWIQKLEKGFLSFSSEYIHNATLILGKILFEKYQKIDLKGYKKEAADGYISLFNNDKYPRKIRAKSAFNAAVLYLEMGNTIQSLEWLVNSLNHSVNDEIWAQGKKTLTISEQYYLLQDFQSSKELSRIMLNKFCTKKSKLKNNFWENIIKSSLVEQNIDQAKEVFNNSSRCKISNKIKIKMGKNIISHLSLYKLNNHFFNFFEKNKGQKQYQELFKNSLFDLYWHVRDSKTPLLLDEVRTKLKTLQSIIANSKSRSSISNLFNFENYENDVDVFMSRPFTALKKFDEKFYNKELETKFLKLKEITDRGITLIKTGDPSISIGTYVKLIKAYSTLSKWIQDYTPMQRHPDFVKGFKKQMSQLARNLWVQKQNYLNMVHKTINDNKILTIFNKKLMTSNMPSKFNQLKYMAELLMVPMDSSRGINE